MTMIVFELRRHLAAEHDVRILGADWATLTTIHEIEHRPGVDQDHEHDDGPSAKHWARECTEFGCAEEAR